MPNTTFFIEDFMSAHNVAPTLQSTRFLEERGQRSRNIDQELLKTPAMTSSEWKDANYLLRNLYTRVAAHGLHHRIPLPQQTMPTIAEEYATHTTL